MSSLGTSFREARLQSWPRSIAAVNVCIHDFDDVKEESNKAASNDKHLLQE